MSVVVTTPAAPDPEPEPVVVVTADVTVAVPLRTVAETVAVESDPPLAATTAPVVLVRGFDTMRAQNGLTGAERIADRDNGAGIGTRRA